MRPRHAEGYARRGATSAGPPGCGTLTPSLERTVESTGSRRRCNFRCAATATAARARCVGRRCLRCVACNAGKVAAVGWRSAVAATAWPAKRSAAPASRLLHQENVEA